MGLAQAHQVDKAEVLAEALLNAGKALGMTQADLGQVIGKDRSVISRGRIEPESKSGELALLLIRIYRALYVLVGGEPAHALGIAAEDDEAAGIAQLRMTKAAENRTSRPIRTSAIHGPASTRCSERATLPQ